MNPRERIEPASGAQQTMWLLERLTPGLTAFNIPLAFRMRGELDPRLLEQALNAVVARHEALRTALREHNGEVVQVVHSQLDLKMPVDDLSGLDPEVWRDIVDADLRRAFDTTAGPLVRAGLTRLARDDWFLLISLHHLIFDGWSMAIFFDELADAYRALHAGRPFAPPLPEAQFADFARWEREHVTSRRYPRQLEYWRDTLAGMPPLLTLRADRPRPAVRTGDGGTVFSRIPAPVTRRLEEMARDLDATLFVVLVAAFAVLLGKYSGQDDVCVGTQMAVRTRRQWEKTVGLFVNTVPLRVKLRGEPSVRQLVDSVRDVVLGAMTNLEVPLGQIVEVAGAPRSTACHPLFQVLLTLQSGLPGADGSPLGLDGVTSESVPVTFPKTVFDLDLLLGSAPDGGLDATLQYCSDLFDPGTVTALLRNFAVLLESFAADEDGSVDELSMVDSELPLVGETGQVPVSTVAELFERQAGRTPDGIAVVSGHESLTYAELDMRSTGFANALRKRGVGAEDIVAVLSDRNPDLVVATLGVLKAGAACLPLDPAQPLARHQFLVDDARPALLVTTSGTTPGLQVPTLVLDDVDCAEPGPQAQVWPHCAAYVLYTSGSTGRPKGVVVTHENLVNQLCWLSDTLPVEPGDRILWRASPCFDASVQELWSALVTGATAVCASPAVGRELDLMTTERITAAELPPSLLATMLQDVRFRPAPDFHTLTVGGEVLPASLAGEVVRRWQTPVRNMYGPTETTIQVTSCLWTAGDPAVGDSMPIGRPVLNTRIHVLDAGLQPVPPGVAGELYVGGRQVTRGYLRRPALTAERFVPDPFGSGERLYRTGDVVRLVDGQLVFLGRTDHQVNLRGHRIELDEVEAVLRGIAGVRQAGVVVRGRRIEELRLVAFVVLVPEAEVLPGLLREEARRILPAEMVPSIVITDHLPMTPNAKLDRATLASLPIPSVDQTGAGSPRTPVEQALCTVWADVLGVGHVGIDQDFFASGGNSLTALTLARRIETETKVAVHVADVRRAPTVAAMADLLASTR